MKGLQLEFLLPWWNRGILNSNHLVKFGRNTRKQCALIFGKSQYTLHSTYKKVLSTNSQAIYSKKGLWKKVFNQQSGQFSSLICFPFMSFPFITLSRVMLKNDRKSSHHKIFKVCLSIFQTCAWKIYPFVY